MRFIIFGFLLMTSSAFCCEKCERIESYLNMRIFLVKRELIKMELSDDDYEYTLGCHNAYSEVLHHIQSIQ